LPPSLKGGWRFSKCLATISFVVPSLAQERNEGEPLIIARRNAYDKALKVWKEYKFATVLGADTVVVLGNKALRKAKG
jgi:septum formation protein